MSQHAVLIGTNKPAVVPALLRREGLRTTVVTEPWYEAAYRAAGLSDVRVVGDVTDLAAVTTAVTQLTREGPVDRVLAPSERAVPTAAYLRSYLDLPGTPFDVAVACTAKHVMKRRLAAAGVPVAPFRVARSPAQVAAAVAELGRPAVVKPSLGTGSRGIAVVPTGTAPVPELDWLTGRMPAAVVEAFLPVDEELHVDGIVVAGRTRVAAVSRYHGIPLRRRADEVLGSALVPTADPLHDRLVGLHDRAVAALGLTDGVTHLEALRTGATLVVGEVAGRPGGGGIVPYLTEVLGLDLWDAWLDVETGVEPAAARPVDADIAWAWYLLPTAAGRVVRVTPTADLRAIDGVVRAHVGLRPGDVVTPRFNSASGSGWFVVAGRAGRQPERVLGEVLDRWELVTTPTTEVADR